MRIYRKASPGPGSPASRTIINTDVTPSIYPRPYLMEKNNTFAIQVTWPQLPPRTTWDKHKEHSNNQMEDVVKQQHGETASGNDLPDKQGPNSDRTYKTVADKNGPTTQPGDCQYLDHTADVQLHASGETRQEAYAAIIVGLHGYMVDSTHIGQALRIQIHASGHDEHSLLYAMLDEFLYLFCTESFVVTRAKVLSLDEIGQVRKVSVLAWGGYFQQGVHPQGTEVKAITYSNMQVVHNQNDKKVHVYVIVDI